MPHDGRKVFSAQVFVKILILCYNEYCYIKIGEEI